MTANPTPQQIAKLCKETTLNEVLSWVTNFNAMTGNSVNPTAVIVAMNENGAQINTTSHFQYLELLLFGTEERSLVGTINATFDIAIPDTMDPDDYLKRLHAAIETMRYPSVSNTKKKSKFPRRKWTAEEDAAFNTTMTMGEIASLVNRSKNAVMSRRWQLRTEGKLK